MKKNKYTLGEEIANSITHGIGALLSLIGFIYLIIFSIKTGKLLNIFSSIIYGISLIILYMMSTMYHSLKTGKAKDIFRILDHCSIYVLIAGTYTPYSLIALPKNYGIPIFIIIWSISILGIVLNAINIKKFKIFSQISYILLGWIVIFAFKPIKEALNYEGFILLISGGISYTLGALFYYFGRKVRYFHSIFHLFVLAGSILHFFSIILYVI